MRYITAFFRLIRIGNILMMLFTQALAYYFLTNHLIGEDLLKSKFIFLLAATFLAAASGYIINDYLDVKIDQRNKPHRVIVGYSISRRWAMFLHLVFNVIAFALGLLININVAASIILCALALWFYSVVFKKSFLSGNILIAALSAFVLLLLRMYDYSVSGYLIWAYAWFAFTVTLIREIIKDIEDMKGDAAFKSKTIPIVWGVRKTRMLLMRLTLVFIVSIFMHLFIANSYIPFAHSYNNILYVFFMLLFVLVPLFLLVYLLSRADTKSDFSRLSFLCKLIMLSGMLSMIFIKI